MICHDVLSQNTWLIWVVKNTAKPPKNPRQLDSFFCALDLDPINLTLFFHISLLLFLLIIILLLYYIIIISIIYIYLSKK